LANAEAEARAQAEARATLIRAVRDDMGASPAAIAKALRQELAKAPIGVAIVPPPAMLPEPEGTESPGEWPTTLKGWILRTEQHCRPMNKNEHITDYAKLVHTRAAAAGFNYKINSIRVAIHALKKADGAKRKV
jgi:hypothetical protein